MTPSRGQGYRCDVGYGAKPWLIVSNNARNRHTADVIAIRDTSSGTPRAAPPTSTAQGAGRGSRRAHGITGKPQSP
jgi:mRNA interferase MazF